MIHNIKQTSWVKEIFNLQIRSKQEGLTLIIQQQRSGSTSLVCRVQAVWPSGEGLGFRSRSDHLAGVVSCWTLVLLLVKQAGDFKPIIFSRYICSFQLSDMYQCKQARCSYA